MNKTIINFQVERAEMYEEFADILLRLALDSQATDDNETTYKRLMAFSQKYRAKEKDIKQRYGGRR